VYLCRIFESEFSRRMGYYDWLLQRKRTSLCSQEARQRYVFCLIIFAIIFGHEAHYILYQINLYLEQPMEIQLFATFFQRRK
jgi:hypothetical protein